MLCGDGCDFLFYNLLLKVKMGIILTVLGWQCGCKDEIVVKSVLLCGTNLANKIKCLHRQNLFFQFKEVCHSVLEKTCLTF